MKSAAVLMPGAIKATAVHAPNGKGAAKNGASSKNPQDSNEEGSDDDVPVAKRKRAATNGKGRPVKKRVKKEESDDDFGIESEDDKPIAAKKRPALTKGKRKLKEESDADDEEGDQPLKKAPGKRALAKKVKKEEDASSSETPQLKKRGAKAKKEVDGVEDAKGKKKKKEEEEEEEVYKWWEQQQANGDGSEKWQILEHNGVYFPPPYEPLPANIKMRYNGTLSVYRLVQKLTISIGKPVDLPPAAEEVAGFYAALLETDHAKDAVFNKNFFEDFLQVLKKNPPVSASVSCCQINIHLPFLAQRHKGHKVRALRLPPHV